MPVRRVSLGVKSHPSTHRFRRGGRKYDGKLLIKPAKKNVLTFMRKIREVVKEAKTAKQETVIARLNPIIRGWANYHRNQVAKDTFGKVDHAIWQQLWQWACRRHRDHRETGGQAAMAVGGNESLAGWNLCPYSEPNAPL